MKTRNIKTIAFLFLLAFSFSCEDVDVENFNDPDLAATLTNADDYPQTLAGAYLAWWDAIHKYDPYMTLMVAADFGSSSWGNFNMREVGTVSEPYGLGDHSALNNTQSAPYTGYLEDPWYNLYSAISTANDILFGISEGNLVGEDQNATDVVEFQALLIRGMSYGYLGLLFDQGFIVLENTDLETVGADTLVPYSDLVNQAVSDLEDAISIGSEVTGLEVTQFNGLALDASQSLGIANSYIAKFLAQAPRTAAEASSVDWNKVKTSAENGIDFDLAPLGDGGTNWWHANFLAHNAGWIRVDQKLLNSVDPTQPFPFPEDGTYEVTLDNMEDQRFGDADSGAYFELAGAAPFRADRGIYFYSFFKFQKYDDYRINLDLPMITFPSEENDLLLAEALVRLGSDLGTAADLINKTRVTNGGLAPATATDIDLLDKVFYERYLEAFEGPGSPFFDRRRTDDLGSKQFNQFPIPALELGTLEIPLYTFGG